MEGETRAVSDNSGLINAQPISILVVDDDTTCLAIVAAKLKKFQYHVVTVKHPNDALCTLRIKGDAFDLVISDVHMPDMNGIQLQQVIAREFNLPVVLMSADKKEDVVLEGLESGAAFYISKPVSTNDLRDLWQFAITKKKKSHVVIAETGCFTHEIITSSNKTSRSDEVGGTASSINEIAGSTSSVNEVTHDHNKDSKRKPPQKEDSSGKSAEISESASQKKQKVVWTDSLHNRFLQAVESIGLDRAVPKKILKVMNVPSITRANIASHLQKYRIFLRRVTDEANLKLLCSNTCSSSRTFSPIFTPSSRTSSSSLCINNLTRMHNPSPESFLGAKNAFFLNREGLSRDILGQPRSLLLSNARSMLIPNVASTNRTTNNEFTRRVQNIYENITSVQGNISGTLSPHFDPLVRDSGQGNISGILSPHFDPLVLDSTAGVNLETADYGFSNSHINDGIINPTFNSLSSTTSKDSATPTNFVGLNISNIQQLHVKSAGKQPDCDGMINNSASDFEFQTSTTVGIGLGQNQSPAINIGQMAGDQLWDYVLDEECQMLQSNVNVENGLGESTYDQSTPYRFSTMIDLDELLNLPLGDEHNLNPNVPTSTDQVVNLQNQVQNYDNVSWFDQALKEASTDTIANFQNQNNDNVSWFDQALNEASTDTIVNVQNQNNDNVSWFDQALKEASSTDTTANVQNQNNDNVSWFDQALKEASTDTPANVQNQNNDNVSWFDQALKEASTDTTANVQNQNNDNLSWFDQALKEASTDTTANVQNQNNDNLSWFDQALNEASTDTIVNVQNQNNDNLSWFDQALNEDDTDDLLESLLDPGLGLFEENYNFGGI